MLIIVVTVIVQGFLVPASEKGSFNTPLLTINGGIFQAIGVISFGMAVSLHWSFAAYILPVPRNLHQADRILHLAFVCHHNSLLIYGSLKTPTIDNFSRVTHYSTGISMLACLILAVAGFLTFGDATQANILNNFSSDNTMVNIARLCFGLNMLTTLPLEGFVCREVMLTYFYPDAPFNMRRHVIFSTGIVVAATALSLTTCDLGIVFELVGATSAVAMAYILPPMCYIKLTTRSWRTYMAYAVVVFGIAVMIISVVQAGSKIIHGQFCLRSLSFFIPSLGVLFYYPNMKNDSTNKCMMQAPTVRLPVPKVDLYFPLMKKMVLLFVITAVELLTWEQALKALQ